MICRYIKDRGREKPFLSPAPCTSFLTPRPSDGYHSIFSWPPSLPMSSSPLGLFITIPRPFWGREHILVTPLLRFVQWWYDDNREGETGVISFHALSTLFISPCANVFIFPTPLNNSIVSSSPHLTTQKIFQSPATKNIWCGNEDDVQYCIDSCPIDYQ